MRNGNAEAQHERIVRLAFALASSQLEKASCFITKPNDEISPERGRSGGFLKQARRTANATGCGDDDSRTACSSNSSGTYYELSSVTWIQVTTPTRLPEDGQVVYIVDHHAGHLFERGLHVASRLQVEGRAAGFR